LAEKSAAAVNDPAKLPSNTGRKELNMKRLILMMALASGIAGGTAVASDYRSDDRHIAYVVDRGGSLERHINHLNRMVDHVRWELRRYHATRQTRREFEAITREVNRVNYRYRRGAFSHWGLRREVERLHERLHGIEERLRVRSRDYYRWD
jgi:hypothetical protein